MSNLNPNRLKTIPKLTIEKVEMGGYVVKSAGSLDLIFAASVMEDVIAFLRQWANPINRIEDNVFAGNFGAHIPGDVMVNNAKPGSSYQDAVTRKSEPPENILRRVKVGMLTVEDDGKSDGK